MLTPTGVTYAQYWSAIKAGNPTHVRFTFLGQNIVLDDTDVYLNSGVVVTDMFNGDTDLVFGRTLSKQITVTFLNSSKLNDLKWTGEFTLEFGVDIGSPATTYWVNMGYFTGEKPKNVTSVQTIAFTAYDRMGRFDILADEFVKSLTYPKTVSQIYDALCSYVGLQNVSGDELASIMSRSFASAPAEMEGYTCRDLLAMIAEACGCYAKITAEGKVKLVWFTDNTAHAVTGTEEFSVESGDVNDGMTWDEADTFTWDEFDNFTWNDVCGYQEALRVDRLYVKQLSSDMDINYPYDYGDMVYSIVDNPFLSVASYADVTSYLKPIYDRLSNFGGYLPVSLECVGNWCVEAGDIITIDVNNLTITFPIFVKSMRWSGAINDAYETTGTTNRQVYSSEANKQRVMTSNKIEMYVTELEEEIDSNYYKIRSGIAIAPEGVTISGSRYINMESGSKIDIKNGADLDIESGGDINVKSGGNFNIASGGNMNVHAAGTLELTGGTGSILMDSNGINVSGGKYVKVQSGSSYMDISADAILCQGGYGAISTQDEYTFSINGVSFAKTINGNNYNFDIFAYNHALSHYAYYMNINSTICQFRAYGSFVFCPGNQTNRGIRMTKDGNYIVLYGDNGIKLGDHSNANYGDIDYIYGDYIYYNHLSQNSSKEVKHDIKPLESIGDKLDGLKPVTFVYDYDKKEEQRMGLIYEDTINIMPEICTNDESEKAINYVELIPALLKEIQELRTRVKTLEEREVD